MNKKLKIVRILSASALPFTIRQGAVHTGVIESSQILSQDFTMLVFHGSLGKDKNYIKNNVQYYAFQTGKFFKDYLYLKKISKILKKIKADIIHIHNRPFYAIFLRKKLGSKVKIIIHEHNHNLRDTISAKKAKKIFEVVDRIITISKFAFNYDIKEKFAKYLNKTEIVYNGVNLDKFQPKWQYSKAYLDALKDDFSIPSHKKIILYSGAIEKKKGIHLVLDAFQKLANKYQDIFLIIAGGASKNLPPKGEFGKYFFEKLKEIGNMAKYLGIISPDNMPKVYLLADIFCAPSLWEEPFGLVFVEAMASGLPVITSSRGGIPEIVIDQKTGLIAKNLDNSDEIYQKLQYLIENDIKRQNFAKEAYLRVSSNFSWQIASQKYREIYLNLFE